MPLPHQPAVRAVVLGASIAGLLAARVQRERFSEVVLLERDALPPGAAARKGTPNAQHPHGLLARGRQVLEELLPGCTAVLVAPGRRAGRTNRARRYVAPVQRAAVRDRRVAGAFVLVMHLLAAPASLFAPALLWRVRRSGARRTHPTAAPANARSRPATTTQTNLQGAAHHEDLNLNLDRTDADRWPRPAIRHRSRRHTATRHRPGTGVDPARSAPSTRLRKPTP